MPRRRRKVSTAPRLSIFISSSQREFERLRKELKEAVEDEELRFSRQKVMRAVLIEEQRGDIIPEEIKKALDDCSLYVGIFGRILSEWVAAELREARASGIPLLIYYLKRRRGRGRPSGRQAGRRSKVEGFLDEEARRFGILVRGPYRREEDILDAVLNDLAYEIMGLTREVVSIRRVVRGSLAKQRLQS